ncbi:hypothetical protein ONS95_002394 [Cadophora gregata]|uniref:uncharacterized protein n=1 Tax=Cadophora gregata TaxID=51156 RepID=UPI0026DB0144|nr:uncharacterized protein ONS95_002394 [Cadophora gregata]KAK0109714.1 hypothetical protein ONS95_002394 [Cadophora gregata]
MTNRPLCVTTYQTQEPDYGCSKDSSFVDISTYFTINHLLIFNLNLNLNLNLNPIMHQLIGYLTSTTWDRPSLDSGLILLGISSIVRLRHLGSVSLEMNNKKMFYPWIPIL